MTVKILPSELKGSIQAISSKSYAHRILIACALCETPTKVHINHFSEDIKATITAITNIGCKVDIYGDCVTVTPSTRAINPTVFCNESGTTARMLLPVLSAIFDSSTLTGAGSLLSRPFGDLVDALHQNGTICDSPKLPINISNKLNAGDFSISGGKSSQYISGLMYALPLLKSDSNIILTSPLQSQGYVDMTVDVINQFGVQTGYNIKGNQNYTSPNEIAVEGDWSNSAFWLASGVDVIGLNNNSLQKDSLFNQVKDCSEVDVGDIPDLVPILAVYSAIKKQPMRIYNASRLKIKESNRIDTVKSMMKSIGVTIQTSEDELVIDHKTELRGGVVDSFNDHRIVMASAIAGCYCKDGVTITNTQAVDKSYPLFFEHFKNLGGKIDVITDR